MYQGKNPTAHISQGLLLNAMNELLTEKELKNISVSELCCRSGVSRQTFYSLFGKKENIILYQLELSDVYKSDKGDNTAISLIEMCRRFGSYVVTNYTQLTMLAENGLTEVLFTHMSQSMISCRQSFITQDDELREYAALFVSAGLCLITQKYIKKHKKPNENELTKLAYKIMSGTIYHI